MERRCIIHFFNTPDRGCGRGFALALHFWGNLCGSWLVAEEERLETLELRCGWDSVELMEVRWRISRPCFRWKGDVMLFGVCFWF
jgi:hypothetical protein